MYNKPRLVFAVDSKGKAISYIHLDKYQVNVILDTIELMQNMPKEELDKTKGWVCVRSVYKEIKKMYPLLGYNTFNYTLYLLAGAKFIDMKNEDNKHENVSNAKIYLTQNMYHHLLNLNLDNVRIPRYLKGTRYMCLAQTP